MRVKKRQTDFGAISRNSMQKDFKHNRIYQKEEKRPQIENAPEITTEKRISYINERCEYAKYARYFIGRLVRCVESKMNDTTTGWYEFVFDDDRKALNGAAGWSDNKKRYYLERPKFEN